MSTLPFIYNGQPSRVIFGKGSLQQLEAEIDLLGARQALILCTPEQRAQAEQVADLVWARLVHWTPACRFWPFRPPMPVPK